MPGFDMYIDPVTHDYVDDGWGDFETDDTLQNACYLQMQSDRGRWPGDGEAGSDLWQLQRGGSSSKQAQRAAEMVRAALKVFVDLGWATDLQADVDQIQTGKWAITAAITDVQHGQIDLTPSVPSGGV